MSSSSTIQQAKVPNILICNTKETAEIGAWVHKSIQKRIPNLSSQALEVTTEASFLPSAVEVVGEKIPTSDEDPLFFCMVIVVFFDGTSDAAKANFTPLKSWAAASGGKIVVQALNAKKGQHSLFSNEDALISSLSKKLPPGLLAASAAAAANENNKDDDGTNNTKNGTNNKKKKSDDNNNNNDTSIQSAAPKINYEDMSEENLLNSVNQGQGECVWLLLARNAERLEEKVKQLKAVAKKVECEIAPVSSAPKTVEANLLPESERQENNNNIANKKEDAASTSTSAEEKKEETKNNDDDNNDDSQNTQASNNNNNNAKKKETTTKITPLAWEYLVRRSDSRFHMEMRVCVCGNVDSGKSTLTSVLTKGFKDDGRGFARAKVFNHRHEELTGRTSSISENHLGFDALGEVVNYPKGGPTQAKHAVTSNEMFERSAKMLTLYDLAGHERYLKTTVLGMTRSAPDYAVVVISANNGIQRMTREHLGLCLALRLPFFIVVTRIDATPEKVREETMQSIRELLKLPTVRKLYFPVKTEEDAIICSKNLRADRICPVFEVSNVTMEGIERLVKFLNLLPLRRDWHSLQKLPGELIVDSTFFVTGVGTVVGGIISQGIFKVNDTVMIGPDGTGNYRPTQIKSIHVKGYEVDQAECGNDAALCLRKERRNAIRKGNVVVHPAIQPKGYWQFTAEIRVLYHSTTIQSNYEPVIHTPTARQAARISLTSESDVLRTGDTANVKFHFLYRPEYLKIGHRIIFREGRTKGIGQIVAIEEAMNPEILGLKKAVAAGASKQLLANTGTTGGNTNSSAAAAASSASSSSKANKANAAKKGGKN